MSETSQSLPRRQNLFARLVIWFGAGVLGAAQALPSPYGFATDDAVSYLDIADAYLKHHWSHALNGYWSPLYSWVLAIALWIGRPSPRSEILVLRATNLALFFGACAGFTFFLHRLMADHRERMLLDRTPAAVIRVPDWMWLALGYGGFFWASFEWIGLRCDTPDMCASALIYVAAGLAISTRTNQSVARQALFGLVLGFAYLAKTAMLPVAVAFLLTDSIAAERRPLLRSAVCFAAFLIVAVPFAARLSLDRGHATIGDAGKLNYAWLVHPTRRIVPDEHWQGGAPDFGVPIHTTRLIDSGPAVFEFAGPVGGTYPPWTDPSYWYEGLTLRFDAASELHALWANGWFYYRMFFQYLIGLVAVMFFLGGTQASLSASWRHYWVLIVPACMGLTAYAGATNLEIANIPSQPSTRFVAPFAVVVFASLLAGLRLPESPATRAALARTAITASVLLCGALAWSIANDLHGVLAEQPVPWRVADALHAQGIEPGDSVAILGRKYGRNYDHEFWARLAHIKIVSSVPDDAAVFRLPVPRQRELCAELALTGAKAIVYKPVSSRPMSDRWQLLSDGYYAYPLSHATDGEGVLAPERLVTPGAWAAFRDGGQGRVSPGMRARGTSRRERTASSRRRSPDTD